MQKPSKVPTVSPTAHVATNATVIGDVTIGDECCVLFNATIRGDCDSFVRLGERSNVQEGACLHVSHGSPTIVGHDVTIGHAAVVHGCTIGDHSSSAWEPRCSTAPRSGITASSGLERS